MRLATIIVMAFLLLLPKSASAATIGTFEWVYDVAFGTGSTFNVTNQSLEPFVDVFVDLFAPGAIDPFRSLSLGDVAENGGVVQSLDDLSGVQVPSDLDRALLRLTFANLPVTAGLSAAGLQGDPLDFLSGSIEVVAPDQPPPPQPVPEPGTLILMGSAIGALRWRYRRTQSQSHGR